MDRPTLKDRFLQQKLDDEGFVVIENLLTNETIERINDFYELLYDRTKTNDPMYWNSLWNLPKSQKTILSDKLWKLINPKINDIIDNYLIQVITIMVKHPEENNICESHRDYSVLDERCQEYYNAWIPLMDINKENAPLFFMPKSHKRLNNVLPMLTKWPYEKFGEEIRKRATIVYPKRGDLVIYKEKTVHGSLGNNSGEPRANLHFGILPKNPKIKYYQYGPNGIIEEYSVDRDFYLSGNENFKDLISKKPCDRSFHQEWKFDNIETFVKEVLD